MSGISGWAVSKETGGWVPVDCKKDVPLGFTWSATQPVACTDRNVDIERKWLLAYPDPLTGSDRYLKEAASERAAGDEAAAVAAELKHLARKEEIRKEFPWLS